MRDFSMRVLDVAWQNRGKVLGTLVGFILGWIFLSYGLLRTLVVLAFLVVGYTLGARLDAGERPVPEWVTRFGIRRKG